MPKANFLYANDKIASYPITSWYTATAHTLAPFPKQTGDESTTVAIVGAGYTGLSTALHLAKAGFKVVVLEAHRVGWGASGRNGGQLSPSFNQNQYELEAGYGREMAKQLWDLSVESVELCKDLIKEHQIACDLKPGIITAYHRKRFLKGVHAYIEKLAKDYDYQELIYLDQAQTQAAIGSGNYYGGVLNQQACHLHPLNFALGLAKAAQQAGAVIYEASPVLSYSEGQKVVLHLAEGKVTADYLVLAANGYLDDLAPKVAARVMPINNYLVASEVLPDELANSILPKRYAVADSRFVVNYYRMSADQRLIFGGGESYSSRFPKDIKFVVKKRLLEIYPQLSNIKLDYAWGGTLAITMNRLPYVRRLSHNVLSAGGYSGHGVALATLSGKLMAEAISGQLSRFDVLANLKSYSFPGGTVLRWPLLVAAMTYYSLRDKL